MNNIKFVTDSNCDLTYELIKANDISVVPQYINFEDDSFKDGVDLLSSELYKKISKIDKLPKTAAPSPADFYEAFKPAIDEGANILCVCSSSNISSTFQNAIIASREFPDGRIEIINSMNISMGIGLLVLTAVDLTKSNLNFHEIANILRSKALNIKTTFIIDTLEYMRKGGRCSSIESFIGDILKIRPFISIVDGKLTLIKKIRGNREKALKNLLDIVIKDKDNIDLKRIVITHSTSDNDAQFLKNEIIKAINVEQVIITETGCSVSTHCGPNTISIIYLTK